MISQKIAFPKASLAKQFLSAGIRFALQPMKLLPKGSSLAPIDQTETLAQVSFLELYRKNTLSAEQLIVFCRNFLKMSASRENNVQKQNSAS